MDEKNKTIPKTIHGKIKTMSEALAESESALGPSPASEVAEKISPPSVSEPKNTSPPISEDDLDELLPLEKGGHVFVREQAPLKSSSENKFSMKQNRADSPHPTSSDTEPRNIVRDELKEEIFPEPDNIQRPTSAGPEFQPARPATGETPPDGGPREAGKDTEDVPADLPGTTQHSISPAPINAEQEAPLETPEEILGIEQPAQNLPQTDDEIPQPQQSLPADAAHQVPQASENLGIEQPARAIPKELSYEPEGEKESSVILNLLMLWYGNRSKIIMIGSIIIVSAITVGGLFYFMSTQEQAGGLPSQIQAPGESGEELGGQGVAFTPPTPFVIPDFIQEIVIEDFQKATLLQILANLKENEYPAESTTYLPIRLSETTSEGQAQYLSGELFLNNLDITTPQDLFNVTEPQFMLYLYNGGDEEEQVCQNNNISGKECSGVRLGMVFKAKEGRKDELKSQLATWIGLENANLESLILADTQAETPIYETGEYKKIEIKYANLPISTMSLDFAVVDNLLIFATSKNSLTSILDKSR